MLGAAGVALRVRSKSMSSGGVAHPIRRSLAKGYFKSGLRWSFKGRQLSTKSAFATPYPDDAPAGARWLACNFTHTANRDGRLLPGLHKLDVERDWLLHDPSTYAEHLRLKRDALAKRRSSTFRVAHPRCVGAQKEVLMLVMHHLATRFPSSFSLLKNREEIKVHVEHENGCVHETYNVETVGSCLAPLELAGMLLQEDLVLVRPGAGGEGHHVDAGFVTFSFGRVHERVGMTLEQIHQNVDRYDVDLTKPVNRFFDRLASTAPAWRTNFGLTWSPTLVPGRERYPFRDAYAAGSTVDSAAEWMLRRIDECGVGHAMYLKVEYQTIRRLCESEYMLFTVRSFVEPLSSLATVPDAANALALNVRHCARGDFKYYLGLEDERVRHAVLEYLDHLAMPSGNR